MSEEIEKRIGKEVMDEIKQAEEQYKGGEAKNGARKHKECEENDQL